MKIFEPNTLVRIKRGFLTIIALIGIGSAVLLSATLAIGLVITAIFYMFKLFDHYPVLGGIVGGICALILFLNVCYKMGRGLGED